MKWYFTHSLHLIKIPTCIAHTASFSDFFSENYFHCFIRPCSWTEAESHASTRSQLFFPSTWPATADRCPNTANPPCPTSTSDLRAAHVSLNIAKGRGRLHQVKPAALFIIFLRDLWPTGRGWTPAFENSRPLFGVLSVKRKEERKCRKKDVRLKVKGDPHELPSLLHTEDWRFVYVVTVVGLNLQTLWFLCCLANSLFRYILIKHSMSVLLFLFLFSCAAATE